MSQSKAIGTENTELVSGLLPYLPIEKIQATFNAAPGDEIRSGKFTSPESSAALAANTFGYFLDKPENLPPPPGLEDAGWPAERVALECCVRFPWSGGRHPWLDTMIETPTWIVGVESKRYEPFRSRPSGEFSKTYWRDVWGDHMRPFELVRDGLAQKTTTFEHLDAVQLVKHAFGLRTEGRKTGKSSALFYVYAEPADWPDGRLIDPQSIAKHRDEIAEFADLVRESEVRFAECSYQRLLAALEVCGDADVCRHAKVIRAVFRP